MDLQESFSYPKASRPARSGGRAVQTVRALEGAVPLRMLACFSAPPLQEPSLGAAIRQGQSC